MTGIWQGALRKMRVAAGQDGAPASYALADGFWDAAARSDDLPLNAYLGRELELRFTGKIACVYCGRTAKKVLGEGFCYPCFRARAEADQCIVRPELCHYHDAAFPCRDDAFALRHCFQPHILYAALTSAPKIGITRRENIPTRWLDQGATAAVPLAELPDRRSVGLVEARLRDEVGLKDRTHWKRLLAGPEGEGDLASLAAQALALVSVWVAAGVLPESERVTYRFTYPVLVWPRRVVSFNLDQNPVVRGPLQGIKGQYLIFADGVINLRKYTGYQVEISA